MIGANLEPRSTTLDAHALKNTSNRKKTSSTISFAAFRTSLPRANDVPAIRVVALLQGEAVMDATLPGHTPATSSNSPMSSEWEYEYNDNETEDFYFTLDVTTLQSQSGSIAANDKKTKGRLPVQPTEQLQLLDLHSDNPLIKLGEHFYSCHWSTDLGTQFYVAKPGIDEKPLKPGHVLDVIGISRARLTGEPVTLHRRRPDALEKPVGSTAAEAIVLDEDEDAASAVSTPTPMPTSLHRSLNKNINRLTTARQNARDPLVKAQASFLERLAIIKRKKGEKDAVPVSGVDDFSAPTRSGVNAFTLNGKRKSFSNDALDSPGASNSSKKLHVPVSYGTSTFKGEASTTQIQRRESNNGNETYRSMLGSSNVDPRPSFATSIGTETGETRAAAQSGADEDLSRADLNDGDRPAHVGAAEPLVTERSPGQP